MLRASEQLDDTLGEELKGKLLRQYEEDISLFTQQQLLLQEAPLIKLSSSSSEWVFGNIWFPIPTEVHGSPLDLLFVAHRSENEWVHATEGDPKFAALVEQLPPSMLVESARSFITGTHTFNVATDLGLPWERSGTAKMTGGPHGNSGGRPFSALDFKPTDGIIRAPAPGAVTVTCGGVRLRIDHGNSYSTQYYHVDEAPSFPSGYIVSEGEYLGRISTRIDCGGRADGPHVHFALRRGNEFIRLEGVTMGGWTFYEGSQAYRGRAVEQRTGRVVNVGGLLTNYGSAQSGPDDSGLPRGTVVVGDGNRLIIRTGPSTKHQQQGRLQDGSEVRIKCTSQGELVTGSLGTSDIWNQLSRGGWVADAWLNTGNDGPVAIDCACTNCP